VKGSDYTDLRRGQELFWTLITSPKGVRAAIEDLRRSEGLDESSWSHLFAGDGRLPAIERLDIYANMYFYRLLDCLGEDFSKVRAAVGPDRFENLIADYLERHPSENPSLRFLGRRLPEFIASHSISSDFPWLSDLARLEWARADIFDAVDVEPLSREGLARLPQDRAGEARFSLIPALAVVPFKYEVVRLWRLLDEAEADEQDAHGPATGNAAHDGGDPHGHCRHAEVQQERLDPPALRSCVARIWRQNFAIHHCSIDADEAHGLELVRSGESLARICQALAAGRSVSKATARAGRLLQTWLDDGLIAGVTLP
jgi:hypothetical protein